MADEDNIRDDAGQPNNGNNAGAQPGKAKGLDLQTVLKILTPVGGFIVAVILAVQGFVPEFAEEFFERRDWVQPEESIVGQVLQNGVGMSGVAVTLIDSEEGKLVASGSTGTDGYYEFGGVQEGSYSIAAKRGDQTLGASSVIVRDGDRDKQARTINVGSDEVESPPDQNGSDELSKSENPVAIADQSVVQGPVETQSEVQLKYRSEINQAASTPGTTYYHVVVWVEGPSVDAGEVESVTYYLHPTFQPSVVTRFPADRFILEFDTWGEFTIVARVNMTDGSFIDLEVPLDY